MRDRPARTRTRELGPWSGSVELLDGFASPDSVRELPVNGVESRDGRSRWVASNPPSQAGTRARQSDGTCLPCRRSWVRIPSAASKRACINAGFLAEPRPLATPMGYTKASSGTMISVRRSCSIQAEWLPFPVPVLLALIQLVPYGRAHKDPTPTREARFHDARTQELFDGACADCHSDHTSWPLYSNVAPISWLVQNDVDGGRRSRR
jgi:hypothetical protein